MCSPFAVLQTAVASVSCLQAVHHAAHSPITDILSYSDMLSFLALAPCSTHLAVSTARMSLFAAAPQAAR